MPSPEFPAGPVPDSTASAEEAAEGLLASGVTDPAAVSTSAAAHGPPPSNLLFLFLRFLPIPAVSEYDFKAKAYVTKTPGMRRSFSNKRRELSERIRGTSPVSPREEVQTRLYEDLRMTIEASRNP
jgi:hypothetical protein